ncbi:unnamed protein product, partial [Discosporangium mesarthrocarpum]
MWRPSYGPDALDDGFGDLEEEEEDKAFHLSAPSIDGASTAGNEAAKLEVKDPAHGGLVSASLLETTHQVLSTLRGGAQPGLPKQDPTERDQSKTRHLVDAGTPHALCSGSEEGTHWRGRAEKKREHGEEVGRAGQGCIRAKENGGQEHTTDPTHPGMGCEEAGPVRESRRCRSKKGAGAGVKGGAGGVGADGKGRESDVEREVVEALKASCLLGVCRQYMFGVEWHFVSSHRPFYTSLLHLLEELVHPERPGLALVQLLVMEQPPISRLLDDLCTAMEDLIAAPPPLSPAHGPLLPGVLIPPSPLTKDPLSPTVAVAPGEFAPGHGGAPSLGNTEGTSLSDSTVSSWSKTPPGSGGDPAPGLSFMEWELLNHAPRSTAAAPGPEGPQDGTLTGVRLPAGRGPSKTPEKDPENLVPPLTPTDFTNSSASSSTLHTGKGWGSMTHRGDDDVAATESNRSAGGLSAALASADRGGEADHRSHLCLMHAEASELAALAARVREQVHKAEGRVTAMEMGAALGL